MEAYKSFYHDKKVLVTGGAGAIGSNLTKALAELGAQVIVVDDLSSGQVWNVPSVPNVLFVKGSILDEVILKRGFFEPFSRTRIRWITLNEISWSTAWAPCGC